jgi:hypothetical protein
MENTKTLCRLTTFDNPWNPFTDFYKWFVYDSIRYNSSGLVARIADTFFSDVEDENERNEEAIDQIMKFDPGNLYRKVKISANLQLPEEQTI